MSWGICLPRPCFWYFPLWAWHAPNSWHPFLGSGVGLWPHTLPSCPNLGCSSFCQGVKCPHWSSLRQGFHVHRHTHTHTHTDTDTHTLTKGHSHSQLYIICANLLHRCLPNSIHSWMERRYLFPCILNVRFSNHHCISYREKACLNFFGLKQTKHLNENYTRYSLHFCNSPLWIA